MDKRTTSEVMLLILSAAAAVIISPFTYLRYIEGDFILAIVNVLIVLFLSIFCIYVYATRKVEKAKVLIVTFITIAIVIVVFVRGKPHLFWLYPAIIAFYYALPERIASVFCVTAISIITVKIYPMINFVDLLSIVLSLLLTFLFSYMIFSNYRKTNEKLALLATIDPLTRSGNRRALDEKLSNIVAEQNRQAYTVSLLLLDLDLFKSVNDKYGHSIGDHVLIEFTSLISGHTRTVDTLFRYGGEEFIILPLKVALAEAAVLAEKLRLLVEKHKFINDISLTVSIGVAQYRVGEKAETWIHRADSALYYAKNTGRNKVVTEDENIHP